MDFNNLKATYRGKLDGVTEHVCVGVCYGISVFDLKAVMAVSVCKKHLGCF